MFSCTSLHGSAVLYTTEDYVVLAGTTYEKGGKTHSLKKDVRLRAGTVFMPRLVKDEDGRGEFHWSIHPYGIHEAVRAAMHTRDGYEVGRRGTIGEIAEMEGVRGALDLLLSWIANGTRSLSRGERLAIRAFIAEEANKVGDVRDPRKRAALVHMMDALAERDRLGRFNVSVRMAKVVAAHNDLSARLRLIWFISPRIGTRAVALALEAERVRQVFGRSYVAIDQMAGKVTKSSLQVILTALDRVRVDLETVKIGPYPAHIARLVARIDRAKEELKNGSMDEATRQMSIIRESLRCKRARWDLEELIMRVSAMIHRHTWPDALECQAVAKEIKVLHQKVAKGIDDSGFEKPVRTKVVMLLTLAEQFAQGNRMKLVKDHVIAAARLL